MSPAPNTTAKSPSLGPLPAPEERPEADVVIYDGHCRICTSGVRRLVWWDCQDKLAYLSLHDPAVAERYPDLSHEVLMKEMVLVDRHGHRHHGAEAIRYLTRRLRRLWWLAPLLHLPGTMPLWRWLYRQVARRRYRLGRTDCPDDACQIHRR